MYQVLEEISLKDSKRAIDSLEEGKVLYLPSLGFELKVGEERFLSPKIVEPGTKNISYDPKKNLLKGTTYTGQDYTDLHGLVKRYCQFAADLIKELLPHYTKNLVFGRTSFRPVEVKGRESSYKKDDTRLHVDAFPATPVKGNRILRVFTNVNREGKNRVWRLGEPFEAVAGRFAKQVRHPFPAMAHILKLLRVTKELRTPYDHYMLNIHDQMKGDLAYQKSVFQQEVQFPPGSTWIVYTDQVSHAAMGGQHLFEQTFYLAAQAMSNPEKSPLGILERITGRKMV